MTTRGLGPVVIVYAHADEHGPQIIVRPSPERVISLLVAWSANRCSPVNLSVWKRTRQGYVPLNYFD